MSKENSAFIISNTETYNKFLLTISSSSFPVSWYMIKQKAGWICGLKISLVLFLIVIIMTMAALYIASDDPDLEGCSECIANFLDRCSFILFIVALILVSVSILQV